MKDRPILFSTPMVKAILSGKKTMTRRLVKPQPIDNEEVDGNFYEGNHKGFVRKDIHHYWKENFIRKFSPWQDGDKLWVRETWAKSEDKYYYAASVCSPKYDKLDSGWKPSIHMPREACRIILEVKDIRLERLHDIDSSDAIQEGIEMVDPFHYVDYFSGYHGFDSLGHTTSMYGEKLTGEVSSFASLWSKINGLDSWTSNPWVYVIEFKKGGESC